MTRSRYAPAAQWTAHDGREMTWCQRCDRYVAGRNMVHVQDYGHADGKRAGDLVDGDVLVFSFGRMGIVRSVTAASRCFVSVNYAYVDRSTGRVEIGTRRCKPDTLLPIELDSRPILRAQTVGNLPW